jgi:peptide/nickel transport system substrate-binding protein
VKPELATHWEANDDLSSYTFYLRQGVKFHHGKDFKAEDVIFTFNRLLDPVLDSPARTIFNSIENMEALDDHTVRFDLTGPNLFFPESLSIYFARILPADVDEDRLTLEEFGTGPFIITEHLPVERTTMVRNPDYWEEGKPYLDELVIVNIPEPATRSNALQNGDIDILYRMESQSAPAIEAHPDTVVLELASPGIRGVDMDIRVPPFDNVLVRKAIQAATDREAIRQAAFLGRGGIAYDHIFPAYDPRYDPQYNPPAYDPELARSLLAQAGYPDGIDLTLHTSTASPGLLELAVALKESAAPAGININVERRPEDIYWDDVWMVEPFTVVSWFGRANVDQALSIQYHSESSWNAPRYFNDELDMLIERARGETLEEQLVTYARIQEILVDDVPRLVTTFVPTLWGARNDVRGVTPHPLDWGLIQDAWFDR